MAKHISISRDVFHHSHDLFSSGSSSAHPQECESKVIYKLYLLASKHLSFPGEFLEFGFYQCPHWV